MPSENAAPGGAISRLTGGAGGKSVSGSASGAGAAEATLLGNWL
jgi:hypothetical protein